MTSLRLMVAAMLLALVIFGISALPTQTKHAMHIQGQLHPWLHVLGFALLAFLLLSAARTLSVRLVLFACLLLFGYFTEARESRKDGWPIEQRDVKIDVAGTVLGSVAALLLRARSAQHAANRT